jgi:hypothetical protein
VVTLAANLDPLVRKVEGSMRIREVIGAVIFSLACCLSVCCGPFLHWYASHHVSKLSCCCPSGGSRAYAAVPTDCEPLVCCARTVVTAPVDAEENPNYAAARNPA